MCYYFNENGYLVVNTTTPDNYMVNENGAWIENGLIVTRPVGSSTENANISTENSTSQNIGNVNGSLSEYDKQFDRNHDGKLDENELIMKNFFETNDFNIGQGSGLRDWQ